MNYLTDNKSMTDRILLDKKLDDEIYNTPYDGVSEARKDAIEHIEQKSLVPKTATVMKYDTGKVRMDLLPPFALESIAEIFTFGAKKYSDWRWAGGMEWSRIYAALQRHMTAWQKGEPNDVESGKSHLWHAGCCIMMLIELEKSYPQGDDRPNHYFSTKTQG